MGDADRASEVEDRLIDFAVRVIKVADALPKTPAGKHIVGWLEMKKEERFVICYLLLLICHLLVGEGVMANADNASEGECWGDLSFVICHFSFVIWYLLVGIWYLIGSNGRR